MTTSNTSLEWLAPGALAPNPRNVRTHSKKQLRAIAASIAKLGFNAPIGALLCAARGARIGGVTQTKRPPANPGRDFLLLPIAAWEAVIKRAREGADHPFQPTGHTDATREGKRRRQHRPSPLERRTRSGYRQCAPALG